MTLGDKKIPKIFPRIISKQRVMYVQGFKGILGSYVSGAPGFLCRLPQEPLP